MKHEIEVKSETPNRSIRKIMWEISWEKQSPNFLDIRNRTPVVLDIDNKCRFIFQKERLITTIVFGKGQASEVFGKCLKKVLIKSITLNFC